MTWRLTLLSTVLAAGCSLPSTEYSLPPEGADAATSGTQRIVLSTGALDVDEGATVELGVSLALPPMNPLAVQLRASSAKLGLSTAEVIFTPETYSQPQMVRAIGLSDPDTVDENLTVMFGAAGVDPVALAATVHDKDVVGIVTDLGATPSVTLDERTSTTFHVHLSAKPTAAVTVSLALSAGPVTADRANLLFTPDTYGDDQAVTLTAPADANIVSEMQTLTLAAPGVTDVVVMVRDVDKDTLNIAVTPGNLTVDEQGPGTTLSVTLTQQPPASVTVAVTRTTNRVTLDKSTLTFTTNDYNVPQLVRVTAAADANVVDEPDTVRLNATGLVERTVSVTVHDDDTQRIVTDAPATLPCVEGANATFHVSLAYQPIAATTIAIASLEPSLTTAAPGFVTFDANTYMTPILVTVHGTEDNNVIGGTTAVRLFESSMPTVDIPVSVTDDDTQIFVVTSNTVSVQEGSTASFGLSLAYDPVTPAAVSVESSLPASVTVMPGSVTFDSGNYMTPVPITLGGPVDRNTIGEAATITIKSPGIADATVAANVADLTVNQAFGFPTPFTGSATLPVTNMVAMQITTTGTTTLDAFGVYSAAGGGGLRFALYADDGTGRPGSIVLAPAAGVNVVAGNTLQDAADTSLPAGTYWIAVRLGGVVSIGQSGTTMATLCSAGAPSGTGAPWPSAFPASTCSAGGALNLWIDTYHQ